MKTGSPTTDTVMVRNVVILGLMGVIAVKSVVSGLAETPLATASDATIAGASIANSHMHEHDDDVMYAEPMATPARVEHVNGVIAVEPQAEPVPLPPQS